MGLFDFLTGSATPQDPLAAGPIPSGNPTPAPISPPPTQNMAFRIPVLGSILDTSRDLLVGPGNENLTTQEQITRGILNTLVLAKAPQSLGAIYGANQQRDAEAIAGLSSPQFQDHVDKLILGDPDKQIPGLDEATAIKQAAREYNISSGIALPTTRAGLPAPTLASTLLYGKQKQTAQDIEDINTAPVPPLAPGVDPSVGRAALRRRLYGNTPMPGDLQALHSIDTQIGALVPDPIDVEKREDGNYYSKTTGLIVPRSPISSGVPVAGAGVPPAGADVPPLEAGELQPGDMPPLDEMEVVPVEPEPEGDAGDATWEESKTWDDFSLYPRRVTANEINKWSWRDIPEFEETTKYNPAKGKDEVVRTKISTERRVEMANAQAKELYDYNKRVDDAEQANVNELAKATTEQERTYKQIEMAANDLLQFVENEDGSPNYDVFTRRTSYPRSAKGAFEAVTEGAWQKAQGLPFIRNIEGNEQIALFQSRSGLAAQILARVITKDRVSEQDWATFRDSLPDLTTPHDRAERMIKDIPKAFKRLYQSTLSRERAEREGLNKRRAAQQRQAPAQDTQPQAPPIATTPNPKATPTLKKSDANAIGW